LLENVSNRAGADSGKKHLVFCVGGQHDHLGVWQLLDDPLCGLDPASARKPDIH
jgi:hypothetical protein